MERTVRSPPNASLPRAAGSAGTRTAKQARALGPAEGPPAGFNPLARNSFRGYRYFVSLYHSIELENAILIAPGLDPLDQLDGEATSPFGFPRNTSRLEAGVFGQGIGVRLSVQYTGTTPLDGAGPAGDLFFGDLATVDIRVFGEVDELLGRDDDEWLENLRLSVRMDNVFDGQRRVVDANGVTPLNYQPVPDRSDRTVHRPRHPKAVLGLFDCAGCGPGEARGRAIAFPQATPLAQAHWKL